MGALRQGINQDVLTRNTSGRNVDDELGGGGGGEETGEGKSRQLSPSASFQKAYRSSLGAS